MSRLFFIILLLNYSLIGVSQPSTLSSLDSYYTQLKNVMGLQVDISNGIIVGEIDDFYVIRQGKLILSQSFYQSCMQLENVKEQQAALVYMIAHAITNEATKEITIGENNTEKKKLISIYAGFISYLIRYEPPINFLQHILNTEGVILFDNSIGQQIKVTNQMYETAQIQFILGDYENAAFLFDYLTDRLGIHNEILNNDIAKSWLHYIIIIKEQNLEEQLYAFPCQRVNVYRNRSTNNQQLKILFKQTSEFIEKNLNHNYNSFDTHLLLSIAYALEEDALENAWSITEILYKIAADDQQKAKVLLQRGIIQAMQQRTDPARSLFQRVAADSSLSPELRILADCNLEILEEKPCNIDGGSEPSVNLGDVIDELDLYDFSPSEGWWDSSLLMDDNRTISMRTLRNSTLVALQNNKDLSFFQKTYSPLQKNKLNLAVGDAVKGAFNDQNSSYILQIPYDQGHCYIHQKKRLIFYVSSATGLVEWWGIVYSRQL